MGKPCEWPGCTNDTIHGDKTSKTEYGEMCMFHALRIQMYNLVPPSSSSSSSSSSTTTTKPQEATEQQ